MEAFGRSASKRYGEGVALMKISSGLISDYVSLMEKFQKNEISIAAFKSTFLSSFKEERRPMSDIEYQLPQTVFGDVDCYTADESLRRTAPDFYLNEASLRDSILLHTNLLLNSTRTSEAETGHPVPMPLT